MRHLNDALVALLIPTTVLLHLVATPYTKVEESFNIQATHDILAHGLALRNASAHLAAHYDHVAFPGAVPRSFVGALALAGSASPFAALLAEGWERQVLVRAILGLFNAFCLLSFRNGVARNFGRAAANWFVLLQASQFHVVFYASRTLPNSFAFGLATLALRDLLPSRSSSLAEQRIQTYQRGIFLLIVSGVVFRSELAILLATHTIYLLITKRIAIPSLVHPTFLGSLLALSLTISIDSYFWLRPVWPELSGFLFNVVHGKAADWGTSPFHVYISRFIPSLLLNPLSYLVLTPLAIYQPATRRPSLDILIPSLTFVSIYSLQPHKEARFIIYIVPSLTAVAALGASWIWTRRTRTTLYRLLNTILLLSTLASFTLSTAFLLISRLNYPGAVALNRLHALADATQPVIRVHMDTLSCTTGVTHFLELNPRSEDLGRTRWIYSKEENQTELAHPAFWAQFDYALTERPERVIGLWTKMDVVHGYAGIGMLGTNEEVESWETVQMMLGPVLEALPVGSRDMLQGALGRVESLVRGATGGRWVGIRMVKKLTILGRERDGRGKTLS